MSVQTWAKALTFWVEYHRLGARPAHDIRIMYYDGYRLGAEPGTPGRALLDAAYEANPEYDAFCSPEESAAAACDALHLPWQQHPVWRMRGVLEKARQYMEDNIGCDCRHDADLCEYCDTMRDIITLHAAKGGG